MKRCPGCQLEKPLADFGKHAIKPDGLRSRCRLCERKPARQAACVRCEQAFSYRRTGGPAHLCTECTRTHYRCYKCQTVKLRGEFYKSATLKTGVSAKCKDCTMREVRSQEGVRSRKASAVRTRYGITLEAYEALLLAPDGTCPCCGRSGRRKMVMDHDHTTGEIRGVICSGCNTGIGSLGDSIEGLERAIAYLNRTS